MNTAEAKTSTKLTDRIVENLAAKLTDPQRALLHDLAGGRRWGNQGTVNALVRKGMVREDRPASGWGTYPVLTDLGRTVHDSIWTPERAAAEARALKGQRAEAQRRVAEEHAALEAVAADRNAASARLAVLLGGDVPQGSGDLASLVNADLGAKPHGDWSGVSGGTTYGGVTSVQLLALVEAVLAAQADR